MMIHYKTGYRHQLTREHMRSLPGVDDCGNVYVRVEQGFLIISQGYAWDGASGPAIDTPSIMRGSLVHDALYQLIREKHLPQSFRKRADQVFREICKEAGMGFWRRNWVYLAVRIFGRCAADPSNKKGEQTAP